MFIDRLSTPVSPLTTNVVGKLIRPQFEPDYVLTCLSYALLKSRYKDYRGITGKIAIPLKSEFFESFIHDREALSEEERVLTPAFIYVTFDNNLALSMLITRLKNLGMTELEQVNAFVKQTVENTEIHALIHKDTNTAFVFANTGTISVYHLTIAFFAALFPKPFEDKPLTKEEIDVLKSLTAKTSHKFVTLLSKQLDFAKLDILRSELSGCFKGFREGRIKTASDRLLQLERSMDEALNEFRKYSEQREEAMIILEGLKSVTEGYGEQETEAVDYIVSCPRLHDVVYMNDVLTFNVDTLLTNFDVMKWRRVVDSKDIYNGYRIDSASPFASSANRKLLLDALFSSNDPEISVRMRANFRLYIIRNYMEVQRGDDFANNCYEITNALTNPHFKNHGCPGQNRDQIVTCLRQGDLVSAMECCIAATGSVNIGETEITFRPFVQEILTSTMKIIRRTDGVDMTPAEALLWLLNKQGDKAA